MGDGYNTNGPDNSDEYEDRRPPEEDRTDAQQTVREAVAGAREATVNTEVDVGKVSDRLGVDFSGTEEVEKRGQTYLRLNDTQRDQLLDALRERHGEDALDSVFERTTRWKNSSAPAEPTQGLELTAKAALGITAEVRTDDDGEIHAEDPSDAEVGVYRDLHDASRAFLQQHLGDEFRVHRAVRKRSVAMLTAQSLDKPAASDYYFPTSVLSNHTTIGEVTSGFNDGVTVSWDAQPNDVAVAVDQLRPHDRPIEEAELHVKGGIIRVESDGVIHSLLNENGERPIGQTATLVESPEKMTPDQHRDVADLVEMMMEQDVRVRSEEGAERVTQWFEVCEDRDSFAESKLDALRASVEFVTMVDDRDWNLDQP